MDYHLLFLLNLVFHVNPLDMVPHLVPGVAAEVAERAILDSGSPGAIVRLLLEQGLSMTHQGVDLEVLKVPSREVAVREGAAVTGRRHFPGKIF